MKKTHIRFLSLTITAILMMVIVAVPAFASVKNYTSNAATEVFTNEGLTYTTAADSDVEFGTFKTLLSAAEATGNAAIVNFESFAGFWSGGRHESVNLSYANSAKTIVFNHDFINHPNQINYNWFYVDGVGTAATSGTKALSLLSGDKIKQVISFNQPTGTGTQGEYIQSVGFAVNNIKKYVRVTATFTTAGGDVVSEKTLKYEPQTGTADHTKPYFFSFKAPKGACISKLTFENDDQWPTLDDLCFITGGIEYSAKETTSITISGADKVQLSSDNSVTESYTVTAKDSDGELVSPNASWSLVGEYGTTASISDSGVLTLTKEFSKSTVTIKAQQDSAVQTKVISVEAAEYYLTPLKIEGTLTPDYDMAAFKADLEAADAKAIMTFEDGTYTGAKKVFIETDIYDQNHFGPTATGGLSMPIVYKNGTEDESVRFNLYYSNMQAKKATNATSWLDATKNIGDDSTVSVSGTKYMGMWTQGYDTNLFFGYEKSTVSEAATIQADYSNLKPSAIGFALRHTKFSSPIVVRATITNGLTDETVTVLNLTSPTPDSKAKFVGIKAPEGKFIRYITFNTTNALSIDDVCFVLNERDEEYDKLIPAYNDLKIHENNLTEYIPLDGYSSVDGVKIRWKSSDTSVVTNAGKIYPVIGEEKTVTLTATLYVDGSNVTLDKEFTVTIPAVKPYVIEGVKVTGDDGLTDSGLVAGKKIEKISIKRYDTTNQSITLAVALYDKNKNLAGVSFETVTPQVSAYAHGDITLVKPVAIPSVDISGYTAKVMIWDSKVSIRPIADEYVVSPHPGKITIFTIGDSLMASYGAGEYPMCGWGHVLNNYLDNNIVTVDNKHGVSGMSTRTFISSGTRLPDIESKIKEGDYIFVMLGHNDQSIGYKHSGVGSFCSEVDGENVSYFGYLSHIVDVARDNKANIIFFTPFNRDEASLDNLGGMNKAMQAYANEQNLPVMDTSTLSLNLYNKLITKGEELYATGKVSSARNFARNIFLFLRENDSRYDAEKLAASTYIAGATDSTHFNIYGAEVRAQLAVLALCESKNAISRFENVALESYEALYEKAINDILDSEYYGKTN